MTYATNLLDDTKKSSYLITIDVNYWIERNQVENQGTTSAYVEIPIGVPVGIGTGIVPYGRSLRSSLVEFSQYNLTPGIEDSGDVLPGYDPETRRYTFDDSASGYNGTNPILRVRLYLSDKPAYTYKDPTNAAVDMIQWEPIIVSSPSVSRDISDIINGFLPTQISGFEISGSNEEIRKMMYSATWNNVPFFLWHAVGDLSDVTNVQKIFSGTVSGASISEELVRVDLSDGTNAFDEPIVLPSNNVDFSDLGVSYSVDSRDKRKYQRKIYGAVSGLGSVNVTRPANPASPTTSENRKWVFGTYNGTDSTIADVVDAYSSTVRFNFRQNVVTTDDGLLICRIFDSTSVTDAQILAKMENFGYATGDVIKLTCNEYPSEIFYAEIRVCSHAYLPLDTGLGISGTVVDDLVADFGTFTSGLSNISDLRSFNCIIRASYLDEWASQAGVSVATLISALNGSTSIEITRPVVSRCYLRDSSGEAYQLYFDTHYTIFRDSTEKFYGVQLETTAESDLGISTISGSELVFGRAYGPSSNLSIGYPSIGYVHTNSWTASKTDYDHANSYANSNPISILYEFLSDYCGFADSEIDTTKIQEYLDSDFHKIVTSGSDKNYVARQENSLYRKNFVVPKALSEKMPSKKDFLIELLINRNILVFVNNEGKWTFRYIFEQAGKDSIVDLYDSDFSLQNEEVFDNTDVAGFLSIADNPIEFAKISENDNSNTFGYYLSNQGYFGNTSKKINEVESQYSLSLVNEEVIDEFSASTNYSFTTGAWAAGLSLLYGNRQNILSIRVSREFFNIEIGDCVTIISSLVSGGTKDKKTNRKYMVLGIEQQDDFRILKLSDIAQTIVELGADVTFPDSISINIDLQF